MKTPGDSAVVDRILIRELIDDYSNICTLRDWARLPGLFVEGCAWHTRSAVHRDYVGRDDVVQAIIAVVESYQMVFQMPHAPSISVAGEEAVAATLMHEIVKTDDAEGRFVLAVYHDRLVRTPQGWKFAERVFKRLYAQTTAMPGHLAPPP